MSISRLRSATPNNIQDPPSYQTSRARRGANLMLTLCAVATLGSVILAPSSADAVPCEATPFARLVSRRCLCRSAGVFCWADDSALFPGVRVLADLDLGVGISPDGYFLVADILRNSILTPVVGAEFPVYEDWFALGFAATRPPAMTVSPSHYELFHVTQAQPTVPVIATMSLTLSLFGGSLRFSGTHYWFDSQGDAPSGSWIISANFQIFTLIRSGALR